MFTKYLFVFAVLLMAAVATLAAQTIPAPTATFTASSYNITAGQSVTLTWSTNNATSVNINHVGQVGLSGSVVVTPPAGLPIYIYNLSAVGAGGVVGQYVTITINR